MTSLPLSVCVVLLFHWALASLPAPVNVSLTSNNFLHVLHWRPGPGSWPGTTYKIHTRANGKPQKPVFCASTSCTLQLNKFSEHVLTVQALYNGTTSPKSSAVTITPYLDTLLGPPSLTLARLGNNIQINISLPDADRHANISDIQVFYSASFRFKWSSNNRVVDEVTESRSITLQALEKGQHCVQVKLETVLNVNTPWSPESCITIAAEEVSRVPAVVLVVVPILVITVIILFILLCGLNYTGLLGKLKVSQLAMLAELKPAKIHKMILKPDSIHVEIPVCRLIPDEEDHEEHSNVYINRQVPICSDAASSSRFVDDSAEDTSGSRTTEGSGLLYQVRPEGRPVFVGEMVSEHLSSEEEEELCGAQSEEDCVDLFSVTVAALADAQTPNVELESHDQTISTRAEYEGLNGGCESWWSLLTPDHPANSEEETVGSSGYMGRV